jgi:hypothetical protein
MKVLMVVARGLHLGYIGCYGNEWVQTPALDQLAAEGVVFDQHYADQPDAAGARRAWRTGCYQFPSVKPEEELLSQEPGNLISLLGERNIATFLVYDELSRGHPATPVDWQYSYPLESARAASLLPERVSDAMSQALLSLTLCEQWLLRCDLGILLQSAEGSEELLAPGAADGEEDVGIEPASVSDDSPYGEIREPEDVAHYQLQDRYASLVRLLDAALGCALQELEWLGLLDEVLVMVTSDHGQKLGEDRTRPGSRLFLHEELIHIPLILRLPGKAEAGRRIAALTQSIDILPTLFDAFGVPVPAVHGYSIVPLARGEQNPVRPYACAGLRRGDAIEWALRSPEWAFLLAVNSSSSDTPLESELYVKPEDRWEVNNVRQHHLEFAEGLEQTLRRFVEATRRPGPLQSPELPHPEQEPAKEQQDPIVESAERSIPT